eukprot:CAMPEP_0198293178 /NCGR_PEP_ID=MMETSP1449-20131203/16032_1 /TAXON_ID=420275 /ORGANISM="Attheya septentrionalis, Strain CCMP2084" /LENGTH=590 /DNA_ID=CAMNT_0043992689 /DNA_START=93 /DNA_END=1866 /DNA_ORIENTATION=-
MEKIMDMPGGDGMFRECLDHPKRAPDGPPKSQGHRACQSSDKGHHHVHSSRVIMGASDTSSDHAKTDDATATARLEETARALNAALEVCVAEKFINICAVRVAPSSSVGADNASMRLGLVTAKAVAKSDATVLAIPHDDSWILTASTVQKVIFEGLLPDDYDGWTGPAGWLALGLLNEMAKLAGKGIPNKPPRKAPLQTLMEAWIEALPTPQELQQTHPYLWPNEDDQELLQSSSTKKLYLQLDDLEEDANWLQDRLWSKDRSTFPESITTNGGTTIPCFSVDGFRYAMALVQSRAVFVDGQLRLIPIMDMANHKSSANEVVGGYMGTFGTLAGTVFKSSSKLAAGQEVFASYGPKSAAEYLLEHGFVPDDVVNGNMRATAELKAELDADATFRDDKLDILEFETGSELGSMEPTQTFDVDDSGEPDFALLQFMRLVKLSGKDAFLLESIFRQEVWGFMELPVSVSNERAALTSLRSLCEGHIQDMDAVEVAKQQPQEDSSTATATTTLTKQQAQCKRVRDLERLALQRTMDYLQRDVEALDLKEYYQERRLKDLGLDSEWSDDDDSEEDGLGDFPVPTKRVPGGADYDF